jgi:hypothetical protein
MLFIPDFKMSVPRELHPGSPRASVHCRTGRRQLFPAQRIFLN